MEYLKIEDEIKYHSQKYRIQREIEDMFIEGGYFYIEPSLYENLDELESFYKKIGKESLVKIINGNSDVVALRPDNTTNIIKNIIPKWKQGMQLKLFYNSSIFRNVNNSNIEEIKQLGIEYLGGFDFESDIEVIVLALNILNKFNDNFIMEISNSKYIYGLLEDINIDKIQEKQLKNIIYRKNKFEMFDYIKKLNLPSKIIDCLANIFEFQGNISQVIKRAEKFYTNKIMEKALEELIILGDFIKKEGYSKYVCFDLSMITELDYYDGVIFKGYYPNSFKEIIKGGRYDSFTEYFGEKVSAIGFSVELDEIANIINTRR